MGEAMIEPTNKRRTSYARFKQSEFERLGGNCPCCGVKMTVTPRRLNSVTFDHIVSLAAGGADNLSNGQVMCAECNRRKGKRSMADFMRDRTWELPKENFSLFTTQRHASETGNPGAMNAMIKVCLAKNL